MHGVRYKDRQTDGQRQTQKEQAEKKSACVENRKCKIVRNNVPSYTNTNFIPPHL
jgi:hypothetical protein